MKNNCKEKGNICLERRKRILAMKKKILLQKFWGGNWGGTLFNAHLKK
jgi:hypothetical protein